MDDFYKKIYDDIVQTGFPTEMKVSDIFLRLRWSTHENVYFIDRDENKGREVDLQAYKNVHDTTKQPAIFVSSHPSVEIKKSEKPWVIFTSKRRKDFDLGGFRLLHHLHNIRDPQLLFSDEINKYHPSSESERIGRKCYVTFGKGGENPQAFAAIVSVTKAAIENHRLAQDHKEIYNETSIDIVFYTPVVILDGKLFEAFLNSLGTIELREVSYIPYKFNYASPNYEEEDYFVDIVTMDGLEEYIDKQEKWIQSMFKCIFKRVHK